MKPILYFITFVLSTVSLAISLYFLLGIVFPNLNVRIENWVKKILKKPSPLILGDSDSYIRRRNVKLVILFYLIYVLSRLIMGYMLYG